MINFKLTDKDLERLWVKVQKAGPDDCWNWTAGTNTSGYGTFGLNGKVVKAHRLAWMLANGPIPKGEGAHGTCICHTCDIRSCVNPAHLFDDSHIGNMRDRDKKGRGSTPHVPGEACGTAKLTNKKVLEIRERYAAGGVTQQALADEFNVARSLISLIVNRKNWTHI